MANGRPGPPLTPHVCWGLKSTEWAYIAGFIDGEGCIRTSRVHKNHFPQVVLLISQRDPTPLRWIQNLLEPSTVWQNKQGLWQWKITRTLAVKDILQHIEPFLLVKKDQAQMALKLIVLRKRHVGYKDKRVVALEAAIKAAKKDYPR